MEFEQLSLSLSRTKKNDSQLLIKRLTKDPGQATEAHQRYITDMYSQMNHFYPLAIYFLFPFNLLARDIERPSNLKKNIWQKTP